MRAAQKDVAETCATAQAAINNKFKEPRSSLRQSSLSSLFPRFKKTEASEAKRQLEDMLTKKWHPQLSSVEPLVSFPA